MISRHEGGRTLARLVGVLFVALLAASPAWALDTTPLEIVTERGRHRFVVEVARSPDETARGLMLRRSIPADGGMLFDQAEVRPAVFWMKNTLIPLDILFIEPSGRIAAIAERTVPLSLAPIASPGPVRAVLEINGGTAHRLGIRPGDRVVHEIFVPPGPR